MPFIGTKTTVKIDAEQEKRLKTALGKAIELLPGKTEAWLMLSFEDNVKMYFKGDNSRPCALVEVQLFGAAGEDAYARMTAEVCRVFEDVLGIPSDRTYVKYEECGHWGWNGVNF